MANYICVTCGVQFAESDKPPERCPICEDARQYVGWDGQQWTTLQEIQTDHHNVMKSAEPKLTGIVTEPKFAIGQRALLVQAPEGNVLWDCISLIDEQTVEAVNELGGLSAIACSHPHMHGSMVAWSRAFGDAPIYVHADDRAHVMRPDAAIKFWEGETLVLADGLTLIRGGGHFEGSAMLHWAEGADGKGVMLAGDTIYAVADRRYVTFMYSYPNYIPLPPSAVRRIVAAAEPYAFDRLYSNFWDRFIPSDAKAAVMRSAERYIRAISD